MFRPLVYWFSQPVNLPQLGWTASANASEFSVSRSEHGYVFVDGVNATAVPEAVVKCITGRWDTDPQANPNIGPVISLKRKK